jgi:hypothetical protein
MDRKSVLSNPAAFQAKSQTPTEIAGSFIRFVLWGVILGAAAFYLLN